MIDNSTNVEIVKKIDFGEIDGYGDPKLEQYFLDDNYWERVVDDKTYFVIGRKGTGKSSIYRMIAEFGATQGYIVENKDFGEFPFEKLLKLDDMDFPKPNQYQTIWKNIILNIFAKTISSNALDLDYSNEHFKTIDNYAKTCLGDLVEMHKEVITKTSKTSGGLTFKGAAFGKERDNQISISDGSNNISAINSVLKKEIIDYFKTCSEERKILLQFDRLDDNYNQYQNLEQYYQAIISLFKVVYQLNQELRADGIINAKVILYLRSDIIRELGKKDAESARWEDFCLEINWSIVNKSDWNNSMLLKMINKRIEKSNIDSSLSFEKVFDKQKIDLSNMNGKKYDVFKYIVEKTMHRPRDVIQFCKYIQQEVIKTNKLYFRTIKDAEKRFGFWLINSELANEINPILKNTESLYEMLKRLGKNSFTIDEFFDKHKEFQEIHMEPYKLACYLYDIGVFINIDYNSKPVKLYSSFRNKGRLDRNLKIIIHPGVWSGLNA